MRPTFDEIYMQFAETISRRSTCSRLCVGTVITSADHRKVLAVGYNGNVSGHNNGCDRDEPGNCGCIHSEDNAIINCDSPRLTHKYVYITHAPCFMCAKRLVNLGGVLKVFYKDAYNYKKGLDLLQKSGILVEHV